MEVPPPLIEINAAKRILSVKDALSGSIITGTDKVRSGYGNGDCLYFDFQNRVFALADGTERFPWASRDILMRLSEALKQGVPSGAAGWKSMLNNEIYAAQKYQHKTTFSCLATRYEKDEAVLTIAHGGDSVVTVIDSASGKVLFQTQRNMVFAGRSLEIVDVVEYRVTDRNSRVIISSDGFDDLFNFCIRHALLSNIKDVFASFSVDRICNLIHHVLAENEGLFEHDDIGFIVMDPFRMEDIAGRRVLIGGTQPHEEIHFRAGQAPDLWMPHDKWTSVAEDYIKVGIKILDK